MELLARPEPKKGHEDTIKKIEDRITVNTGKLSSLWKSFLNKNGLSEPTSWPSKHDREFEEQNSEVMEIRENLLSDLDAIAEHSVLPEESAQTHAIMVSLRSGNKLTYAEDISLFLDDQFQDIIQEALRASYTSRSDHNVIRIDRKLDSLVTLTSSDLLAIEYYLEKFIGGSKEIPNKLINSDEIKKLASWCSYWGNLGHGSDVFYGHNYL